MNFWSIVQVSLINKNPLFLSDWITIVFFSIIQMSVRFAIGQQSFTLALRAIWLDNKQLKTYRFGMNQNNYTCTTWILKSCILWINYNL